MPHSFKLSRRFSRLRAPFFATLILALACDGSDTLDPTGNTVTTDDNPVTTELETVELEPAAQPLAAGSFAGGIPIGMNAMPVTMFGDRFNGAKITVGPAKVMSDLAAVRARGGKVAIMMAGHYRYYRDGSNHFSLTKWKERVSRFRDKDFESYIQDGTIVGHYMIDEPNDPANWGGEPVPPSTLEEMAKFSKSLWPSMPTIVRVEPGYLGSNHRYLDVAWAQYLSRRGDVSDYIRRNVGDAQNRGLSLIVGMNVLKGGTPNGTRMTAKQVQDWGSVLLSSSYPCAFFSFEYNSDYLSSSDMRSAMDALRSKAENRSTRSCRRTSEGTTTPPPAPEPEPEPEEPSTSQGLMFGPYGLPVSQMGSFSGSVRVVTPSNVVSNLRSARQAGAKVVLRLTAVDLQNSNGTFSLSKWKAAVDRFAQVDLTSYVGDGTMAGHLLVIAPDNPRRWGGQRISHATLEEMARYSRSRWSAVPTLVQADPAWLATTTSWSWLDAVWTIYGAAAGDAGTWVARQASAAGQARLGVMIGMNVLNGGTSASGIPGTQAGKYAMSATQLRDWGSILVADSRVCGLVLQRYESRYFGRSDISGALAELGRKAAGRQATSCRRR